MEEAYLSLTTPVMSRNDSSCPGENWFFYWKTSPSLWEQKLRSEVFHSVIFAPLFWGLHSPSPNVYDFGQHRPEAHLVKLDQLAKSLGKQLVFLLPITPLPFLPSGGLPSYLAFCPSTDEQGLARSAFDREEQLNKFYSFYDQRVFAAYRKFVAQLGQLFKQEKISARVLGVESCYLLENGPKSFLHDTSKAFDQGFDRFLQQKAAERGAPIESDLKGKHNFQNEFQTLIDELYRETAKDFLGANWSGKLSMAFLGAGTQDTFQRAFSDKASDIQNFDQVRLASKWGVLSSAVLLSEKEKGELLENYYQLNFPKQRIEEFLHEDNFEGNATSWSVLSHVMLFTGKEENFLSRHFDQWFENKFPGSVEKRKYWSDKNFNPDEDYPAQVFFLMGKALGVSGVKPLIKYFLSGGRMVIDRSSLDEENTRRLETFILENNLKKDLVQVHVQFEHYKLGEGMLILFDGHEWEELSSTIIGDLLERLAQVLGLSTIPLEKDGEVIVQWLSRGAGPHELQFQEMRRLCLLNPTSYKAKVRLTADKKYALIKAVDQLRSEFKHHTEGIEILLQPQGRLSLDFGHQGDS